MIHEFRALCQFAQHDYKGAAATLNAVLAVGPGWNWETLFSLYANVDTYTAQLRALERYVDQKPDSGDARFVLAYHYLSTGAKDAAIEQLREVVRLVPKDQVAAQMLEMFTPSASTKKTDPKGSATTLKAENMVGTWKASGADGARFELTLKAGGEFEWKFVRGAKTQVSKGVYAFQGDMLAMEPESGGTMLAQITPQGKTGFEFKPIGSRGTQAVKFSR